MTRSGGNGSPKGRAMARSQAAARQKRKELPENTLQKLEQGPNALPPDQDRFPSRHRGWRWLAILAATLFLTGTGLMGVGTAPGMMEDVIPQWQAQAPVAWRNLTYWIDNLVEELAPPQENIPLIDDPETRETEDAGPVSSLTLTQTATPKQPTSTPTITSIPESPLATINRAMNVRRGPGTHHAIIDVAGIGEEFPITGKNKTGDWWQIDYRGEKAWVYAPLVAASGIVDVQIVPTPTVLSSPTPPPSPTPGNPMATINRAMNVRRGPGTHYAIIVVADIGEEFPIIGKNASGDWWQIDYRGEKAWIYAPYVKATNAGNVRIAPSPTPLPAPTPPGNNSGSRGQRAVIDYVVDGDTVDVRFEAGNADRIRLFDIDTPETYGGVECFGRQATAFTSAFTGQEIAVESRGRDKYDRLLGYIWLADGRMLNEELARQGFAEYKDYGNPGIYAARIRAAADQAKRLGLGMWSQCTNGAAAPTVAPDVPQTSTRYDPNGPDRDCGDFDTHAEAQAFFLAAGGPDQDPHRLDRDKDGSACESLP